MRLAFKNIHDENVGRWGGVGLPGRGPRPVNRPPPVIGRAFLQDWKPDDRVLLAVTMPGGGSNTAREAFARIVAVAAIDPTPLPSAKVLNPDIDPGQWTWAVRFTGLWATKKLPYFAIAEGRLRAKTMGQRGMMFWLTEELGLEELEAWLARQQPLQPLPIWQPSNGS